MDNKELEALVYSLRANGATVAYDPETPETSSVDVAGYSRTYIKTEYVGECLRDLELRAMLGDLNKADILLIEILRSAYVLPEPEGDKRY